MKANLLAKIKICGITNFDDALAAAELGADYIGFVFAPSPRRIEPERAKTIIDRLPRAVLKVGVFVNEHADKVKEIASYCSLDWLQFHGDESPEYCQRFEQRVIKTVRVKNGASLDRLADYQVDAFLLDTYSEDKLGGTGKTFDWNIAREAKKYGKIFLSGGLNAGNVAEAIKLVKPYAVDVSSGIESAPYQKNHTKIRSFIEACRKIDRES